MITATSLLNFNQPAAWIIVVAVLLWLVLATLVAGYGTDCGFPFFPLFASCLMLGPLGPPVVLLAIAIGAGPRK